MTGTAQTATIEVVVDATRATEGLNEISGAAVRTGRTVENLGGSAGRGLGDIGTSGETAARKVTAATANMVGAIQRTTASMEAGSRTSAKYFETLASQRGINVEALRPYLEQLEQVRIKQDAARRALDATPESLNRMGVSAAQTAAALRGVPAQFTDIITSIQGGQAPLTVFLQQGGQLRDMFGSAGGAAKALGGYVVGLVNPLTVGAGAALGLAYAYHEGALEAQAYSKSIILSGNAAGVTSGQLSDMARKVSNSIGTQGAAAESIAALVATGKVSAENIAYFSEVAIKAQRALGQSVGDTATEFADLAKSPVVGLERLNEKYHFLTGSIYEQVKALRDQGREYDAGVVAQRAYADAFDGVTTKVTANLGAMQAGWAKVSAGAKFAWDAMLNIGRVDSLSDQLVSVQAKIAKAQKPLDVAVGGNAADRASLNDNLKLEESLKNQIALEAAKARIQADQARFNAADLDWSKGKFDYLTREKQLETELAAERNKGLEAGRSDLEIAERLSAVRRKYADIENAGIDSNIEALKRLATVQDIVSGSQATKIAADRASGFIAEADSVERLAAIELGAFDRKRVSLKAELDLVAKKQLSYKDQQALSGEIYANDISQIQRKIQLSNDLVAIEEKSFRLAVNNYADQFDKATADRDALRTQVLTQNDYNETIGRTKDELLSVEAARLDASAAMKVERANMLDLIDSSGKLGDTYREQGKELSNLAASKRVGALKEAADEQNKDWKKSVEKYEDVFRAGFADMLNNGLDGWHSFTKSLTTTFKTSVADQIYKMFAQPLVVQVVGSLVGMTGVAGVAQAAGASGLGSIGSIGGAASGASSLYSAYTAGGLVGFGNAALGATGLSGFASGLTGSLVGSASGLGATVAGSATGIGSVAGVGGSIGSSITAGLAAIGPVGWGIIAVAAVAGLASIGKRDDAVVTSSGLRGSFSGDSFSGSTFANMKEKSHVFWSGDNDYTVPGTVASAQQKALSGGFSAINATMLALALTLGTGDTAIKNYSHSIDLTFTGDQAKDAALVTAEFSKMSDELALRVLPSINDFTKGTETASATLQRVGGDYMVVDASLASIGASFGAVGVESITARERLVDLLGGVQNLSSGATFFAQNFLTEAERMAPVAKQVNDSLAALGYIGDTALTTRDQFKAAVLGLQDGGALATEAGAKTFAGLMSVEGAFAQLHPAIDAVAVSVRSLTDIAGERKGLQDQIDAATMNPAQLVQKQRNLIDPGNQALFDQAQSDTAAKVARDALASANKSVQDQVDAFIAASLPLADQRANELIGLDDTTAALKRHYFALQDSKTASDTATAALNTLAAANKSVQDQIDAFVNAGLPLADQRANELIGLDDTTAALKRHYFALQDSKTASDTATAALNTLAAANKSVQDQIDAFVNAGLPLADQRANELVGLDDTTAALKRHYFALQDAKTATDTATAALTTLAAANKTVQDQIDAFVNAGLPLADQRANELIGLDATTAALKRHYFALQDSKAAADTATAALNTLAATNKSVQDQIAAFVNAGLPLADQRANELIGLDATTAALKRHYFALQDQKTAADAAAAADVARQQRADAAAQAAEAARQQLITSSHSDLASAYDSTSSSLKALITNQQDAAKASRAYGQSLAVGSLSPFSDDVRLSLLKQQFNVAKPENAQATGSAYLELLKTQSMSDLEYLRGFAEVQRANEALAMASDGQATIAQLQLAAADASVAGLLDVKAAVLSLPDALAAYLKLVPRISPLVYTPDPAILINPSRVYAASQLNGVLNGDTSKLEAEIKLMREQLAAALALIAGHTGKTSDTLSFVTQGGTAILTESLV